MAKPKPVSKSVVCSECGLAWNRHTEGRKTDPTPDVCIRLLKADLLKRSGGWGGSPTTSYNYAISSLQ
jgi:hypothetical protein